MNWKYWKWGAVVLGVVLLAGMAIPQGGCITPAAIVITSSRVSSFRVAFEHYKAEYGSYPVTSENYRLVKILKSDNPRHIAFMEFKEKDINANGEAIDAWGLPLRISFSDTDGVRVWSAGKDKIFDTKDDITSW